MGAFYIQKPKKLKAPPRPKPKAPPKPPAQKASDKLKTKKKKKDTRYNPYGQGSSANPSNMSARSGG